MTQPATDAFPPPFVPELAAVASGERSCPRARKSFWPSPACIQREIQHVLKKQLSPEFSHWVARYARVGRRNPYLWNWCRQAVEITTLPCVPANTRSELCDTKALGVMWDVLLDDVADRSGSGEILEALLDLPLGRPVNVSQYSLVDQPYVQMATDVWQEIMRRARNYPYYEEYASLLQFDYLQLCNVMRYSHLLNGNLHLLNLAEHDQYTPANMHIMICSTFDLMCSRDFDRTELGKLRNIVARTQWMGRIGNLVTTWQREIGENDFTSGVFARAVDRGDVEVSDLRPDNRTFLEAAIAKGNHESHFLTRWQKHRRFLLSSRAQLKSFAVRDLVAGYERLFCLHLGSRGYK